MLFSRSANSEYTMRRRKRPPIAAHPMFVPALTLWGAALAGLTVMVLPAATINQITSAAALGVLGTLARYFFAAIAAALGAAISHHIATKWRARSPGRSNELVDHAAEQIRPIDPTSELGSESLDTPIDETPEPAEDKVEDEPVEEAAPDLDTTEDADTFELSAEYEAGDEEPMPAAEEPAPTSEAVDPLANESCEPAEEEPDLASRLPLRRRRNRGKQLELVQALSEHRARQTALNQDHLDLSEFTRLAEKDRTPRTAPAPTAVDKLRAVPPKDLSLVQMVERLAVALHERQEAARKRPAAEQSTERDAALAEALKALAVFTERGLAANDKASTPDDQPAATITEDGTERELREALGKLQTMRGAA